jgi:hypothetical protein
MRFYTLRVSFRVQFNNRDDSTSLSFYDIVMISQRRCLHNRHLPADIVDGRCAQDKWWFSEYVTRVLRTEDEGNHLYLALGPRTRNFFEPQPPQLR